jgi:hypothetical protein
LVHRDAFIGRSGELRHNFVRIIWRIARRWNCLDEASQLAAVSAVSRSSVRARVAAQGASQACLSVVDRWAADGEVSRGAKSRIVGSVAVTIGRRNSTGGGSSGLGEDPEGRLAKLDTAGRLRCRDCLTLHLNNRLRHELERFGKDDLHETGPVAQHDERQSAEIAAGAPSRPI